MSKSPASVLYKNGEVRGAILKIIKSHHGIILLLDYDGTLVPIKQTPNLAVLPESMYDLLNRLVKKQEMKIVLVSGRSHPDLKSLVPIKNIMIVSNHGFRISSGKANWVHPGLNKYLPSISKISRLLKNELKNFAGAIVEDKQFTVTVHFRKVEIRFIPSIKKIILESVQKYPGKFLITFGKKVIEVRPNIEWNKGKAVLKVLKMLQNNINERSVIYIGDDKTDEDAFGVLNDESITIKVGRGNNSLAKYYLNSPREVQLFLNKIENIKA